MKFIFDVDGTLTPSRKMIDLKFKQYFNEFCKKNQVFLVTGSDRIKTIEQIGRDSYSLCHTVYNCNGNDVWQSNKHIRYNDWIISDDLRDLLMEKLTSSPFSLRTGIHFEHRPGMCNFSIIGRGATHEQRILYVKYDQQNKEREKIAYIINSEFDGVTATVGGETGIDIYPTGFDKSQILKDFNSEDKIKFYGDSMSHDGNDWPLAQALSAFSSGESHQVKDWQDTWNKLKEFY